MGHRASYVLIEDGRTHIYGSGFGALTVPQDVLFSCIMASTSRFSTLRRPYDSARRLILCS